MEVKLGVSLNAQAVTATRKKAQKEPNGVKQLRIKCNVVTRMKKEVEYYHAEAKANEAIVKKMEDEGRDHYDTKQAVRTSPSVRPSVRQSARPPACSSVHAPARPFSPQTSS